MSEKEALYDYCLRLADTNLILGHRLSEWCGHGPVLEEDIAMTNMALDLIGQSRVLYQYAAKLEGKGRTEDDLAYLRLGHEFKNVQMAEQPNGDFADTMVRQFFFAVHGFYFLQELRNSKDATLVAHALKGLKELTYHLRHTSEWMIRLGDGTEESHTRAQAAIERIWMFTGELYTMDEVDAQLIAAGIGVDMDAIKVKADQKIKEVMDEATLTLPTNTWMVKGGKQGRHSEHLGYILTEMQYLQRAYPGSEW